MIDETALQGDFECYRDCILCPRECHVDRTSGQRGVCSCTNELHISRAAPHFWEEPPISGETGSGTIFISNCNLRCVYCQNHAISRAGTGKSCNPDDVASMCLDLQSQGVMNINFVTPTHFAPHIRKAISVARDYGLVLPIVWNTSGYETVNAIDENSDLVDVYLSDFKYFDDGLAMRFSGVGDYRERAIAALERMVSTVGRPEYDEFDGVQRMIKGVVVRHLILPGHLDDSKKVLLLLHERFGDDIEISIMNQYTPLIKGLAEKGEYFAEKALRDSPELAKTVSEEEYETCLDYADSIGINDYFWQDGTTCSESFIPEFDV